MKSLRYNLHWFWLSLTVLGLDQWSKHWALTSLDLGNARTINDFLNFNLAFNPGIAFSFFANSSIWQRWVLGMISALICFLLTVWLVNLPKTRKWTATALAFIIGGAAGNMWDRFQLGFVVDFIQVHYRNHFWPTFNIGDMFIVTGAIMLIIEIIILEPRRKRKG